MLTFGLECDLVTPRSASSAETGFDVIEVPRSACTVCGARPLVAMAASTDCCTTSLAISRLLNAHETVIEKVRDAIDKTEESKDMGTNDLLMGDVLRRHEMQVWFVAEHLVEVPLVKA